MACSSSLLLVLVGPTASGKTAVSLTLARRLKAEILYADCMCVYRGMDIGTAKPTPEERGEIIHHGIDLIEPTMDFSVADYCRAAWPVIADCRRRGVPLLITGGTGYYVRALLDGIQHGPPPDRKLRERYNAYAETYGDVALHQHLAAVDPVRAAQLHPHDRKRIIRALEVWAATGKPMSATWSPAPPPVDTSGALFVGLRRERSDTVARIAARTEQLFAAGLLDEVVKLQGMGVTLQHTAFQGHGYKEVVLGLQAGKPLERIKEDVTIATRRYARRQIVWWNAEPRLRWVPVAPAETTSSVAERVIHLVGDCA